jgi:hypothetical protein
LSGMQGNLHVPFLGGWAGAIPPGYPAGGSNSVSLAGSPQDAALGSDMPW